MFALGLLTCIVLRAFSAQAKVVTSFDDCSEFFYKGKEPGGMDQNAKRICQHTASKGPFYATLYTVPHRIPLYSAYRFDPQCVTDSGSSNTWHLEPQISQPQSGTQYMVRENQNNQNNLKENQAVSSDYSDTGYDRGHLNPNSFQCGEGRTATFTLTNAAPMDACFNRIHWKSWESAMRSLLKRKHDSYGLGATAYIVTGTVPDANLRIPQREISEDPERVTVPSHIWTAVCYKHNTDDRNSFSFGYIGKNQPAEPSISLMSVSNLNHQLSTLFSRTVQIFDDDCFGDNNKLSMVQEEFRKVIDIRANQGVQMPLDVQNTLRALKRTTSTDSISSNTNVKLKKVTAELGFDSMQEYSTVAENLKIFARSACLITHVKSALRGKREVSEGSDAVQCLLVPEKQKTTADGSPCSSFIESVYSFYCNAGDEHKSGCSSPCLHREEPKGYWCYSGQTLIKCSPRYSLITAEGERCKDDHPCGTYDEDYYWCYKVAGSWDYCSPPLWSSKAKNGKYCRSNHACAKYGSGDKWCYTDDEGNRDECCTYDDCFSAVKDKTCRFNHKCGYHGEKYLWCYTDYENNWDYCCKACW